MLLYITIGILFIYTLVLIGFFMGWCSLFPAKCHPQRHVPFSSIKSPRRNTKFVEIDCVSSSHSAESIKHILPPPKKSKREKKSSLPTESRRLDDYLHPKYSLPPVCIDIEAQWALEGIMRAKERREASIEEEPSDYVSSPPPPPLSPSAPSPVPSIVVV